MVFLKSIIIRIAAVKESVSETMAAKQIDSKNPWLLGYQDGNYSLMHDIRYHQQLLWPQPHPFLPTGN